MVPANVQLEYRVDPVDLIHDSRRKLLVTCIPRPDFCSYPRLHDGGVQLGTEEPQHGSKQLDRVKNILDTHRVKVSVHNWCCLRLGGGGYNIPNITADATAIGCLNYYYNPDENRTRITSWWRY